MTDPYERLQRPAASGATTAEVSEPRRHIREHFDVRLGERDGAATYRLEFGGR